MVDLDQSVIVKLVIGLHETYAVAQEGDLEAREQLLGGLEGEPGHFVQ